MKTLEERKLEKRLEQFLEELVEPMGRSERRHWACAYVEGLLLDGERKSIEPIATRTGADVQALRQYCGALGKTANCQVAVSLHFCAPQVSCPVSWRLYLPREWAEDPQ